MLFRSPVSLQKSTYHLHLLSMILVIVHRQELFFNLISESKQKYRCESDPILLEVLFNVLVNEVILTNCFTWISLDLGLQIN